MKKIITLLLMIILIVSCKNENKKNIYLYLDKEMEILLDKNIKEYEKDNNVNIIFLNEENKNINLADIVITCEEKIIENLKEKEEKGIFYEDYLILIGRRKINSLEEIENSSIILPNYDSNLGKISVDLLSNVSNFQQISKNIEYTQNILLALESVDLYESDYTFINKSLLKLIKNSKVCFLLPKDETTKIEYKIFVDSKKDLKDIVDYLNNIKIKN